MPARGEERIGERAPPARREQRRRQPGRVVAVQELPGLALVAGPEDVGLGRAGPVVLLMKPSSA
jgi:hypothetical protein